MWDKLNVNLEPTAENPYPSPASDMEVEMEMTMFGKPFTPEERLKQEFSMGQNTYMQQQKRRTTDAPPLREGPPAHM